MGDDMARRSLTPRAADYVVAGAKSVLGAVPFAGSLLAEIAGTIIPNQRADRIARFAVTLDKRLSAVEETLVQSKLNDESFTDLVEEALRQAARAITDERLRYIANLLVTSISDEALTAIEAKHLLAILGELNDIEVIRLAYYVEAERTTINEVPKYYEKHESIIKRVETYYGDGQEVYDKRTLQQSYDEHLARLGLLRPVYETGRDGQPILDNRTATPRLQRYNPSALGNLLARQLQLVDENGEVPTSNN